MPGGKLPPDFFLATVPTAFVFLALFTSPLWYNAAFGEVEWNRPEIAAGAGSECILDRAEIRVEHMQMLDRWRNEVVREGRRGRADLQRARNLSERSLTHTCLQCHSNREAFCDRCHTFVGEDPYCWDCHVENGGQRIGGGRRTGHGADRREGGAR